MPTPALYTDYAASFSGFWKRHTKKLIAVLLIVSFTPAVVERVFPSVGPAPGRALFVLMFMYFSAVLPVFLFRRPLPSHPWPTQVALWAWFRTSACNVWVAFCIWFVWSAFNR